MIDRLRRRRLRPAWKYVAGGAIWRIAPGDAGTLIGEARDLQRKEATFFCLDRSTGVPRWEGLSCDGGWWVGIEAVHRGVLLVHGYASPDLPGHRGLTAVDVLTGALLWKSDDIEFVRVGETSVVGIRALPGRREAVLCDLRSGVQTTAEPSDGTGGALTGSREVADGRSGFRLPVLVSVADDSTGLRQMLAHHVRLDKLKLPVEQIESGNSVVIAVHEEVGAPKDGHPVFRTRLLVIDRTTGALRLDELLNEGSGVPVAESCILLEHSLYALKGRNTLLAYHL